MLNVSRELSQVSVTHDAGDARVTDDSGSTRSFASSRNSAPSRVAANATRSHRSPSAAAVLGRRVNRWTTRRRPEECDPGCRRARSR